jgi:hypothetical protein
MHQWPNGSKLCTPTLYPINPRTCSWELRRVNEWLSGRHGLSSESDGKSQWEHGASRAIVLGEIDGEIPCRPVLGFTDSRE